MFVFLCEINYTYLSIHLKIWPQLTQYPLPWQVNDNRIKITPIVVIVFEMIEHFVAIIKQKKYCCCLDFVLFFVSYQVPILKQNQNNPHCCCCFWDDWTQNFLLCGCYQTKKYCCCFDFVLFFVWDQVPILKHSSIFFFSEELRPR